MELKVRCRREGCGAEILRATFEKTGGLCKPCVRADADRQRQEYIKKNRKVVDKFAGKTDPIDILALMFEPPAMDVLIEELPYKKSAEEVAADLDANELTRLSRLVSRLLDHSSTFDQGTALLALMRRTTNFDTDKLLIQFLSYEEVDPVYMFAGAGAKVRDELFDSLSYLRNSEIAFAWVKDSDVVRYFSDLKKKHGKQVLDNGLTVDQITQYAGWEVDDAGKVRELTSPIAIGLHATTSDKSENVITWNDAGMLIAKDILQESGINWDGDLLAKTATIKEPLRLRLTHDRDPIFACEPFSGASQIGGHPGWLQFPKYPTCAECKRTMPFILQIADAGGYERDQIFMLFACADCKTTATVISAS